MRKLKKVLVVGIVALMFSSCATVFGGPITQHQKTKPAQGEPQRDVRVIALIADIVLFWPSVVVDFATGAIYKPHAK